MNNSVSKPLLWIGRMLSQQMVAKKVFAVGSRTYMDGTGKCVLIIGKN
jgi:hypothetical protein